MGDTGDMQGFFLTVQELNHISPQNPFCDSDCVHSHLLITESEIRLVTRWSRTQMHTAPEKALELYSTGFKLWTGDLTSLSLSLPNSTMGIMIVAPHNY